MLGVVAGKLAQIRASLGMPGRECQGEGHGLHLRVTEDLSGGCGQSLRRSPLGLHKKEIVGVCRAALALNLGGLPTKEIGKAKGQNYCFQDKGVTNVTGEREREEGGVEEWGESRYLDSHGNREK